jgi:hypothetical protein
MRYNIHLTAGIPVKQFFRGRGLSLVSTGTAAEVNVKVYGSDVQNVEDFGGCDSKFSVYYQDGGEFTGAEFESTVDTVIEVLVSRARVTITDGNNITATLDAGQIPLPVQTQQGDTIGNPLFVTGLTLSETPANTVTDNAAVAAGPVAAQVLAADATRLEIVFCNLGPDPVALGMVGITWAKRCIVLGAGDTYTEWRAAAKAWYAITDAGLAGSVTTQVRKS